MAHILAGIYTQDQHIQTWYDDVDQYRPSQCPHCGRSGLWLHGVYYRQAQCECPKGNPVPIPRFLCQHCRHTCSTLPEYIPPRRWYHWFVQQLALQLSLAGRSLMQTWQALCSSTSADGVVPSICTLQRWLRRYKQRLVLHRFHLLNSHPTLGYVSGFADFWQACLNTTPLSTAMMTLNRNLDVIP